MKFSHLSHSAILVFLISCQAEFVTIRPNPVVVEKVSCLDHLRTNPSLPNGIYQINHDQDESTQTIPVYCDMSGGGWTRIIKDSTTTVNDLALFGDTSEIASTFYSDPVMGIGWGEAVVTGGSNAHCAYAAKFVMARLWNYTEIKMVVSGAYSLPSDVDNTYGYLYISNNLAVPSSSIANFLDAWTADASGANAVSVNGNVIRAQNASATDLIDYEFTIPSSGSELQLCMAGEQPGAYNQRYIHSMWIK